MASSLALLFGAPALEPVTVVAAAAAFTAACALLGTATAADGQVQPQLAQRWFEEATKLTSYVACSRQG